MVIFWTKEWVILQQIKRKSVHHAWYGWARVRLWKWFSVNTWKVDWYSEKQKYVEEYWPWTLTFTSDKVTFVSDEKSLMIKAKDLIDMVWYRDWIRLSDWKETYHFVYADDNWEYYNKIAKQINPDAPLVTPTEKKEEQKESVLKKRWFWLILVFVLCCIFNTISKIN